MTEATCTYCGAALRTVRVRSLMPERPDRSEGRCPRPERHADVRTYRDERGILRVIGR